MVSTGHKILMEAKFDLSTSLVNLSVRRREENHRIRPSGPRSQTRGFLNYNGEVLAEGLIGGKLSPRLAALRLADSKRQTGRDGLKKVVWQGAFTHHLSSPARNRDFEDLKSFFDPETFRHVKTIYTEQTQAQMGSTPGLSPSAVEQISRLKRTSAGFTTVNKLIAPTQWSIKYIPRGHWWWQLDRPVRHGHKEGPSEPQCFRRGVQDSIDAIQKHKPKRGGKIFSCPADRALAAALRLWPPHAAAAGPGTPKISIFKSSGFWLYFLHSGVPP